jgi:hypothetical protein
MTLGRNTRPATTYQKIEVCAAMGLENMINIQALVTAYGCQGGRLPVHPSAGQFGLRDGQVKTAALHIQLNKIAALYERQRPPLGLLPAKHAGRPYRTPCHSSVHRKCALCP